MDKISFSIIIPVYNSELSISALTDKLVAKFTDKYRLEIVLVNDCSPDNSERVCIDLYKKYKGIVKFYSLAKNVGENNAVMAGLNHSTGDYVVVMDDDFQNPISEVEKLIDYAIEKDYDVIYSYYEKKHHSFFRNLGSKFNDKVANIILKKPKSLYLSTFRLMNRFIVDEIINYDHPFTYIDGLILRTTSNIGQLKVNHANREFGKSNYTLIKLIAIWSHMFTNFSILPLRLAMGVGFLFSMVGFILALLVAIWKLREPDMPLGYASTMTALSIFSGILLIALGMIGEYVGRIFLSQNKHPQFVIRKRFDDKNA